MIAIVQGYLMQLYKERNLVGGVFSLDHFQIEYTYDDLPRYEGYKLVYNEMVILISKDTKLKPLTSDVENGFAFYPLVPSIRTLAEDRTTKNYIVGTFKLFITFIFFIYHLI